MGSFTLKVSDSKGEGRKRKYLFRDGVDQNSIGLKIKQAVISHYYFIEAFGTSHV